MLSHLLVLAAVHSPAHAQEETPSETTEAVAQEGPPPEGKGKRGRGGRDKRGGRPKDAADEIVRPTALVQIWGTAYDQDQDEQADATGYGDPESDPGVSVKRARLGLEGKKDHFLYDVSVGVSAPYDAFDDEDGDIQLEYARVGYRRDGFGFSMGRQRAPFSRDQMMGSGELTFTERGLGAEHISPQRGMGALIDADMKGAKLSLGAYNAGGDIFGDEASGKTLVGRLEYERGGDSYKTWSRNKDLVYGIGGGGFMTDGIATKTTGAGGDILLRWNGVSLLFDAAWSKLAPTDTPAVSPEVWSETTRLGLTGELSYAMGPFQPAVRYTSFDDSSLGAYSQLLGGVTWHGGYGGEEGDKQDHVRLGVGFVHRWEPTERANDTARVWAQFRL